MSRQSARFSNPKDRKPYNLREKRKDKMKSAIRSMSNEQLRELANKFDGGPYVAELRRRSDKQMKSRAKKRAK